MQWTPLEVAATSLDIDELIARRQVDGVQLSGNANAVSSGSCQRADLNANSSEYRCREPENQSHDRSLPFPELARFVAESARVLENLTSRCNPAPVAGHYSGRNG